MELNLLSKHRPVHVRPDCDMTVESSECLHSNVCGFGLIMLNSRKLLLHLVIPDQYMLSIEILRGELPPCEPHSLDNGGYFLVN